MMNEPVFPIPPSYCADGSLDISATSDYCEYLIKNKATRLMTTAGTSQFNLLDISEIHELNALVSGFDHEKILGVPALSLRHTLQFVKEANLSYDRDATALMLLYPDRFYSNDDIVKYFHSAAEASELPCYIHGMFMRNGRGGTYNYDSTLLTEISSHDNIIGMKEENSNLSDAYNVCNRTDTSSFEIIVAGGSMRRFLFLEPAGASTFLTGVGNLHPTVPIAFREYVNGGDRRAANDVVKNTEAKIFDVFMRHGWHRSLRSALKVMGLGCEFDRAPFSSLNKEEEMSIIKSIKTLEEEIEAKQ